ncbi:MAG: ATP synthase F0 subunit B [Bdellovibrionales bacterium]|nr:ATP synthase F0 subunit B [Bdellovibrionales bacterium]
MDILASLGVNSTLGIQLVIFLFSYFFLTLLIFGPYHRAYEERVKRTEGNTEIAERILAESKELEVEYEQKARALNNETKIIFDRQRSEAMKEYDRMVSQARDRAKSIVEKNRSLIGSEFLKAKSEIKKEIPLLVQSVERKMVGTEADL